MIPVHDQDNNDADVMIAQARTVLRERFGYEDFLPGQERALRSVFAGRNLLVVMPTGSGKSMIYQLPALAGNGLTLVVSPLIALMKDQVDELQRKGAPATFVNSSLSLDEQRSRLTRCAAGEFKLLYVAPERFQNQAFLAMIDRTPISRMAVDEAHCISEWGHDFRPDYRRLKDFRKRIGSPPITALTATATVRVQRDIIDALGLTREEVDVLVHGFDRPNLALSVVSASTEDDKQEFLTRFVSSHNGPGIVYTGTRKTAELIATFLRSVEPKVSFYHAGMEPERRADAQEAFLSGKARVVVATMAFGMGIDKPDVRFVVHYHYPSSVEQYYQEIGRAGRDGLPSECVLLHSSADRFLREFFIDLSYPDRGVIRDIYHTLWRIRDNPIMMTYRDIARLAGDEVKDGQVRAALRLLDAAGLTRACVEEPKVTINLGRPGAEILD